MKLPSDILNTDLHPDRVEETMSHSQHQSFEAFFSALYKRTRFLKVFLFFTFESSDRSEVCVGVCVLGFRGGRVC